MCRRYKTITIFIIIIVIINILSGCILNLNDGFNNKEEVIELVKENIDDLNQLTKEIYNKYSKVNKFVTIENKIFKIWPVSSFEYKTKLANSIFKKLRINYIAFSKQNNRIEYVVKSKFGTYCGFYYSFDNNSYYSKTKNRLDVLYAQQDNWNIELVYRSGWYTEKILDNWYFYENDFDNIYFLNYVKEEIKHMDIYDKVYKRFKKYFD